MKYFNNKNIPTLNYYLKWVARTIFLVPLAITILFSSLLIYYPDSQVERILSSIFIISILSLMVKKVGVSFFYFATIFSLFYLAINVSDFIKEKNHPNFIASMLDIDKVLASKVLHNETFGCTYIIVSYKGNPPVFSPINTDEASTASLSFGKTPWEGYWRETPIPPLKEGWYPIFPSCRTELPVNTANAIAKGLQKQGGWYTRSLEYLVGVLPEAKLAFIIRFGD